MTGRRGHRLGRLVQSCPQMPQLPGSFDLFTHLEVHRSGFGETQLDEQTAPLLVEHKPVGAVQELLQLPQVLD
jgi:hypothetical protein